MDTGLLFDIIAENIDLGIAVIDDGGYFVYYNRAMGEIEGLDPKDVLGDHIFNKYPSSGMDNSTLLKCLATGVPIYNDLQSYINEKGRKILAVVTDLPVVSGGKILGVVEFVQDIDRVEKLYKAVDSWKKLKKVTRQINGGEKKSPYYHFDDFLTLDAKLLEEIERIKKAAQYDFNVLICGETGTGKEILAQSIHGSSNRKDKVFTAQNCAAIPENLLESIFFGTERGSFTGAVDKEGLFEQTDGGTLLLDELNSFPVYLQAKMLRVIQEGSLRRLGGREDKAVDVRIIATVNEDPQTLIRSGKLREDLFFRLNSLYINIPPLRERKEDIFFLAEFYMKKYCALFGKKTVTLSKAAAAFFREYPWRGNVRELIHVIEYAMAVIGEDRKVECRHLPGYMRHLGEQSRKEGGGAEDYADRLGGFEKELITGALNENGWNVSRTAQKLGIKRQTLQNKMRKLNIAGG